MCNIVAASPNTSNSYLNDTNQNILGDVSLTIIFDLVIDHPDKELDILRYAAAGLDGRAAEHRH
jgi:hypothetical protein